MVGSGFMTHGLPFLDWSRPDVVPGWSRDFDDWAAEGNVGWSYADVLPYFKKFETFEDGANDYRGGTGPIKVIRATSPG